MKKILFLFFLVCFGAGLGVGLFIYQAKSAKGDFIGKKVFHIEAGEDIISIAKRLENEQLVASQWYFLWSAWTEGLQGKIRAGDFVISGKLSSPDVIAILLFEEGKAKEITLTFPEGWDVKKIASRLSSNNFDGDGFLAFVKMPRSEWKQKYPVLSNIPDGASLEGFLFPDTYTFLLTATPEDIVEKMLQNFEVRFGNDLRQEALRQKKSIFDIVTMASILEREIGTENQSKDDIERDRKMVSDIFWRRISDQHALESCATVQYILGTNKAQLSYDETRTESPYNTYINKGFPPGPIGNPGIISLRAALFPLSNEYYFFLNHPKTGETFFAKTFEDHIQNKMRSGL